MRLIDADALPLYRKTDKGERDYTLTKDAVADAPTVDAVPVVRCKDCKFFSMTTLGMPFACWHGAVQVWGETGEHAAHHVCQRVDSPDHYCRYAERKDGKESGDA